MKYFERDDLIKSENMNVGKRRIITMQELVDRYMELPKDTTELMLYVDSPFCIKACAYCMFSPRETTYNSNIYKEYYDYVQTLFDDLRDILNNFTISEVYFGGGTPNFTRIEEWNMIKSNIPNFSQIKNKMMECNPVLMTEEKLRFLIDNKFTYISFGIQSLDSKVLKSQNRLPYNVDKVKYYISELKKSGTVVNCDLLAFMETGELKDLETLEKDLPRIWDLGCDMVTLYPMFQRFNMAPDKNGNYYFGDDEDENLARLRRYRSVIYKHLRENTEIELYRSNTRELIHTDSIKASPLNDIILIKKGMKTPHTYNCSGHPHHPPHQVTLGIGGHSGKRIYGHIGRDFYYEMDNLRGKQIIEEVY